MGGFGESIGPKQHFAHSIVRAIESGKYVLRSANNGVVLLSIHWDMLSKKLISVSLVMWI